MEIDNLVTKTQDQTHASNISKLEKPIEFPAVAD